MPDLLRCRMLDARWRALSRLFLLGMLCALPLACTKAVVSAVQTEVAAANYMCPIGSAGCPCTSGGGCDPGLYCDNGICVGDSYDFEDEDYGEELMLEAPASEPARSRGRAKFNRRSVERIEPSAADFAAPAEVVDTSSTSPALTTEARDPADELDHARQVIYTASLHVSVYDLDAAAELAESLPGAYGGWIESRYDYQITLRIRAEHLFEAIADLSALGVVLDKSLLAQDVTAEYIDLAGRIRVLEELVAHLEALLARVDNVELALEIRAALDRARLELASAKAKMRQLSESIDFSTLILTLSLRGPMDELPSSNDPFPWVDSLGVQATEYR